jgi:integrase
MARRLPPGIELRTAADGTRTYRIRWRQATDGRNLSHSFARLDAAVDAKARITASGNVCHCVKHAPPGLATKHFGAPVAPATPEVPAASSTFGEAAARHVQLLTGVGPGYRKRFAREVERHFDEFLERPLDGISDEDVKKWIRGCEDGTHPWLVRRVPGSKPPVYEPRPLSPTTVHRLMVQCSAVYSAAQKRGRVTSNPFRDERGRLHRVGRRDRDQHEAMTILTHEEWAILAEALPAGVPRDLSSLLVGTGLRWGEATALAVGAVDPLAKPPVLHVGRAWQDDGEGGWQLGTPKSVRSRRTVSYGLAVLEALIPHLAGRPDDDFVFTTQRGRPLRPSNFYHRVWLPALDRANAAGMPKRPRIHDLRHTHVSWLIAAGTPVAAISRRVGHDSITTTINTYGHMLPSIDVDVVAALDVAMPVSSPEPEPHDR